MKLEGPCAGKTPPGAESRRSARRMGMEAAMMVMALSAAPRMTNWVLESVKLVSPIPGIVVILTMDVAPALRDLLALFSPWLFGASDTKH